MGGASRDFGLRLQVCVEKAGGKRALANLCGISEAQLYRYLNGESAMPADRVAAVARACGVDAGWLLTGEAAAPVMGRPAFRPALMAGILTCLDELFAEHGRGFSPRQRALAATYIYEALRLEEIQTGAEAAPQKFELYEMLCFLAALRSEEEMGLLSQVMALREYADEGAPLHARTQTMTTYCNLIARGYAGYYGGHAGQMYFDRMGTSLDTAAVQRLTALVEQAKASTGRGRLDMLDIGCGNGRHLGYVHRHVSDARVRGIEISPLAVELCARQAAAGKLPEDAVVGGDFRSLPFADASQDLVFARMSLCFTPYFADSGLGLEAAMDEAARVLRKGGLLAMTGLYGKGVRYMLFKQLLDEDDVRALARRCGLEVASFEVISNSSDSHGKGGQDYHPALDRAFRAVLRKRG